MRHNRTPGSYSSCNGHAMSLQEKPCNRAGFHHCTARQHHYLVVWCFFALCVFLCFGLVIVVDFFCVGAFACVLGCCAGCWVAGFETWGCMGLLGCLLCWAKAIVERANTIRLLKNTFFMILIFMLQSDKLCKRIYAG